MYLPYLSVVTTMVVVVEGEEEDTGVHKVKTARLVEDMVGPTATVEEGNR